MKPFANAVAAVAMTAFAQLAAAQPSAQPRGVQEGEQYGSRNRSSQMYGDGQNTTSRNRARGSSKRQSEQYGAGNAAMQGGGNPPSQGQQRALTRGDNRARGNSSVQDVRNPHSTAQEKGRYAAKSPRLRDDDRKAWRDDEWRRWVERRD